MQLIIREGIVQLGRDMVQRIINSRIVGQFGDSDGDTEAAMGFATGRAERLIGVYRSCPDEQLFLVGPASMDNEALAVWIEVTE